MGEQVYRPIDFKCPECDRRWTAAVYQEEKDYDNPKPERICTDCKMAKAKDQR